MRLVPGNRYLVFILIAGAALTWDLYSKSAVFHDLGYPGGKESAQVPGQHSIFVPRAVAGENVEGVSVPYINGWITFCLYTSFNEGALWGLGQGYSWVFALMSVLAGIGILYWLFIRKAAASLWLTVALALVLGGTLGNLYDRLGLHGYTDPVTGHEFYAVRDFLLFTFGTFPWPVFNFADTYLVTGAIMLVLQSFTIDADSKDAKPEQVAQARAVGSVPVSTADRPSSIS